MTIHDLREILFLVASRSFDVTKKVPASGEDLVRSLRRIRWTRHYIFSVGLLLELLPVTPIAVILDGEGVLAVMTAAA